MISWGGRYLCELYMADPNSKVPEKAVPVDPCTKLFQLFHSAFFMQSWFSWVFVKSWFSSFCTKLVQLDFVKSWFSWVLYKAG